jgi:hypothetical protein
VDPALTTHLGTSFRWRTAIRSVALPQRHYFSSAKPVGSVGIRNSIELVLLDPDPYRECGSGFGSRSKEFTN